MPAGAVDTGRLLAAAVCLGTFESCKGVMDRKLGVVEIALVHCRTETPQGSTRCRRRAVWGMHRGQGGICCLYDIGVVDLQSTKAALPGVDLWSRDWLWMFETFNELQPHRPYLCIRPY